MPDWPMGQRWTIRGQGHGLWPKVTDGPGFEDEEDIVVVSAPDPRGRWFAWAGWRGFGFRLWVLEMQVYFYRPSEP